MKYFVVIGVALLALAALSVADSPASGNPHDVKKGSEDGPSPAAPAASAAGKANSSMNDAAPNASGSGEDNASVKSGGPNASVSGGPANATSSENSGESVVVVETIQPLFPFNLPLVYFLRK